MAQAEQHQEMVVSCNFCKKQKKVLVAAFYQKGGLKGGCCHKDLVTKQGIVQVPCTYSTVPSSTKRQTHKASRDKVSRSARK